MEALLQKISAEVSQEEVTKAKEISLKLCEADFEEKLVMIAFD